MNRKIFAGMILSAALVNPAFAGGDSRDAIFGAILGGAFGAAIGDAANGRDGAILGSAIGAATGTAIATRDRHSQRVSQQRPVYIENQYVSYHEERRRHNRHDNGWHRGHHKHEHRRHHDDD